MSGNVGAHPECGAKTVMTPDHSAFQVLSFGYSRVGIDRSSLEGLNTERYEKTGWLKYNSQTRKDMQVRWALIKV